MILDALFFTRCCVFEMMATVSPALSKKYLAPRFITIMNISGSSLMRILVESLPALYIAMRLLHQLSITGVQAEVVLPPLWGAIFKCE